MTEGQDSADRLALVWFVVIAVILGAIWTSSSYVSCERNTVKEIYGKQEPEGTALLVVAPVLIFTTERRCTGAFIDSSANAIIAIFTIILAISTILLWRETERLAAGGERQHALVNRPFVALRETTPVPILDLVGTIVRRDVIHEWINSGNTPAFRSRTHVSWQSFPQLPSNDFDYPDIGAPDTTEALVAPQGKLISNALEIPDNFYVTAAAGTTHLLTWGWVEYSDGLGGQRHRTEFCHKVTIRVLPNGTQAYVSFQYWGPHNGADDGCLKAAHT